MLFLAQDHKSDQMVLEDFIAFMGYKPREFWHFLEKFWNLEPFENVYDP
jgi:hypothetical protein